MLAVIPAAILIILIYLSRPDIELFWFLFLLGLSATHPYSLDYLLIIFASAAGSHRSL